MLPNYKTILTLVVCTRVEKMNIYIEEGPKCVETNILIRQRLQFT